MRELRGDGSTGLVRWRHQPTGILPEWTYAGTRIGVYREGIVYLNSAAALKAAREILGADAINLPTNAHQLSSFLRSEAVSNGKAPPPRSSRLTYDGGRNRYVPIPYERLFPKDGAS